MNAIAVAVLLGSPVAETLETLLARGPVVSVEADGEGKFHAAVAYVDVETPLERVWSVLTDFASYHEFVPRVAGSDTVAMDGGLRVKWEIDSPGMNTKYTVQYTLDVRAHAVDGRQVAGDLRGSRWRWELAVVGPNRTRIRFVSKVQSFSRVLDALEDEAQTITAGLNVGGAVTLLRALKRRAEERSSAPDPTAGSSR